MYRKQLRKVPPAAPTGFIPESWRKLVLTPSGIDRKYYEFCVLNELKGALRSGDIWVKGSRRYRNFDDYLIPAAEFEKSRHNDQLQLAVQTDCQAYLQARMTLLASRLEEVNGMALAGDLPDVDISDKGVKITPLENSVPSGVSSFADLVYGILPHPKITEILEEVDSWTGLVIPPFLAEVISRIRSCVEYAASVCSHSTPYSDVRYYKTIATEWHSSAIHPVM
jgi:hypothetical protein